MIIKINPEFVKYIHKIDLEINYLEKNIQFIIDNMSETKILDDKKQLLYQKRKLFNLIKKNIEKYIAQNISFNNFTWYLDYNTNELIIEVKNNE